MQALKMLALAIALGAANTGSCFAAEDPADLDWRQFIEDGEESGGDHEVGEELCRLTSQSQAA